MRDLPNPETYERELKFMPYRESLNKVVEIVTSQAPQDGNALDLMCGPGYLLGRISFERPDLNLLGNDINPDYIAYARKNYEGIDFESGDVLSWKPEGKFDIVACTGALHHIPYEKQEDVLWRIRDMVAEGGVAIISDCYIDDYSNEIERRKAAAKLGYEYLVATISNGADSEVIGATTDIIHNDVLMKEFKTSLRRRSKLFDRVFQNVETIKTWPNLNSEYGDYISVCKP